MKVSRRGYTQKNKPICLKKLEEVKDNLEYDSFYD